MGFRLADNDAMDPGDILKKCPPGLQKMIENGQVTFGRATKIPKRGKKFQPCKPVARPVPEAERLDRVTIPIPPSANNLFKNAGKRGRVPSKEYKQWTAAVIPLVSRLRPPASYPCQFFCCLVGKVNQQRDGDNCQKPLLDVCKKAGVITDDNLKRVRGGCWHYEETAGEPECIIWFEPWE